MSGSARGVRSNTHSYRNWEPGVGNHPCYPAIAPCPTSVPAQIRNPGHQPETPNYTT